MMTLIQGLPILPEFPKKSKFEKWAKKLFGAQTDFSLFVLKGTGDQWDRENILIKKQG